jgi:hypothetical protein
MEKGKQSPCPICGEMVTDHPRWRKKHIDSHNETEINEENKEVTTVAEPTAPKAAKIDLSKMRDEERELMERALAKQKENAEAPDLSVLTGTNDEHMELRKAYAPETIEEYDAKGKVVKPAERHAFIADGKNLRMYADRGYVPVLNGQGEFVRTQRGDVLCTLDMATHNAIEEAREKENLKRERTKAAAVRRSAMESGEGSSVGDEVSQGDASISVEVEQNEVPWQKE